MTSIAFLIPVIVETLTAKNSVEISDYETPCNYEVNGYKCAVKFGSLWIDPTAFYFYTNALGVLLQAVILIGMGSLADHGSARKKLMLGFGFLGGLTTTCYFFVNRPGMFA